MLPFIFSGYSVSPPIRYGITTGEARGTIEESLIPLEHRLDSLELACAGMWELLKQYSGLDDEALVRKVREVDAKDGKADGKVTRQPSPCPSCNRPSLVRRSDKCSWCGADLGRAPL